MGAVTPAGIGWQKNWSAVLEGKSGIGPISLFSTQGYRTTIGGEARDFHAHEFMSEKLADNSERFTQLAIAAAKLAMEDSRLTPKEGDVSTGIIIGCGMGGLPYFEKQADAFFKKGPGFIRPGSVPRIMPNAAGSHLAALWKIRGPNHTISTACSSGNHAVGLALDLIRAGRCRTVLCGGAESLLSPITFAAFDKLCVMSSRNGEPERACRPFDKDRDGFVMGEGAVMFVVEEREVARARGASVYAEIAGYGSSNGSYNILAPDPEGVEASESMNAALVDSGLAPQDLYYIHAHGTATLSNDVSETLAIKRTFGAHAKNLAVSSTKAVTGHMIGAAGAMGILVSALSVKTGQIPPTTNFETPDSSCDLDYVAGKARTHAVGAALSNAFAFGSNNATVIITKDK
jgi:3-oxoacyl-[acyl-carrier-protein] synthase II